MSISFRTLCARLRAAIKALTPDERAGLDGELPRLIENGSVYGIRIDAAEFVELCARLRIDPWTGAPCLPQSPGPFHLTLVGAACLMKRKRDGISQRKAQAMSGVSASTIHRLECGARTSADSVLLICEFIGIHPFGYLQPEKRRAA
jgi:hypothetical protein